MAEKKLMCDDLKSKLVEELIESKRINNVLGSEIQKLKDKKRFGSFELQDMTITRDGWRKLEDNIEEQVKVLCEINTTYTELHRLTGCGSEMRGDETGCSSTAVTERFNCKIYQDLKNCLLELLQTKRNLYSILKDNLDRLSVRLEFGEIQEKVKNTNIIKPETIGKLTEDISQQMNYILENCRILWVVQEATKDPDSPRDSGYTSGNRLSQEEGMAESLEILSLQRNDGDLLINMGTTAARRRPSAVEHEEISHQTAVKDYDDNP